MLSPDICVYNVFIVTYIYISSILPSCIISIKSPISLISSQVIYPLSFIIMLLLLFIFLSSNENFVPLVFSFSVVFYCLLFNVHCTLYIVQCTMYNVPCTMYHVHCTMYPELGSIADTVSIEVQNQYRRYPLVDTFVFVFVSIIKITKVFVIVSISHK